MKKEVNPLHLIIGLSVFLVIFFSLSPVNDFITGNSAFVYSNCIDSDGGRNYYEKGSTTDSLGREFSDYCKDTKFIVEYSCGNYGKGYKFVQYCEYGCSNGACLKKK